MVGRSDIEIAYLVDVSAKFVKNLNIQDKVFKSGPSKICGRQPFKKV